MVVDKEVGPPLPRGRGRPRLFWIAGWAFSLVAGSFVSGVAVGAWELFPYSVAKALWGNFSGAAVGLHGDGSNWQAKELESAFSGNVIGGDLYNSPITKIQGIAKANTRAFVDTKGFETAYERIEVFEVEQLKLDSSSLPVTRVSFSYAGGDKREAFSYGIVPGECGAGLATLIVPGSGDNQSSKIFLGDAENYHYGILEAVSGNSFDYHFVLIKHNHDFLAWHNGQGKKLNTDYIFGWHLNRGGSYSASYLLDALAFTKWMNSCAAETAVAGLSQGGGAALMVGLQADPTYAIVASGHSFAFETVYRAGSNQLIGVPGYFDTFREDWLVPRIAESPVRWLFTWGNLEPDIYGQEAKGGPTFRGLKVLDNVTVVSHDGGHVFPEVWLDNLFLIN